MLAARTSALQRLPQHLQRRSSLIARAQTAGNAPSGKAAVSSASVNTMTHYDIGVKEWSGTGKLGDCPFCHRVLLTLNQKGIEYTTTLVDFKNKPAWVMEASQGKVPILRAAAEDLVMADSDKIVVHLEKQHPEPAMGETDTSVGGELFPAFRAFLTSPEAEPLCAYETVLEHRGGKLFPAFREFLFSSEGSEEEKQKKNALEAELQSINEKLSQAGTGPLFGGDHINATDAALAPKLYHVEVALKHFKNFSIPEDLKAVHTYLNTVKTQPAWQKCDYGHDAIIAGWTAHMDSK